MEVKDLREIVKLYEKLKEKNVQFSSPTDTGKLDEEEFLLKMKSSGARRTNPQFQSSPNNKPEKSDVVTNAQDNDKDERIEPEFNCEHCDFQGTEKKELQKHINLKHKLNIKVET